MKIRIILLLAFVLLLSGCSGPDAYLEERMLEGSGVLEDTGYQAYIEDEAAGKLDQNGFQIDKEELFEEADEPMGTIHITFAENSNLNIAYFADSAHTVPVESFDYYINPGDTIYATVTTGKNASVSTYDFDEFRIYEYNDSERLLTEVIAENDGDEYTIKIPDDFQGTELSVEPVGSFQKRQISMKDYYVNDQGKETALNGVWNVNDRETNSGTTEISANASYIISYTYDKNEYFYVDAKPEVFYLE